MTKFWRTVSARALRETREAIRIDSPVRIAASVGAPIAAVFLTWWLVGQPAIAGAITVGLVLLLGAGFFVWKLISVPIAMATEADAANAETSTAYETRLAKLEEDLRVLRTPPPRDPDGLYQHGRRVGSAQGTVKVLHESKVMFSLLAGGSEFNPDSEFEYHDLRLRIREFGGQTMRRSPASIEQCFLQTTCSVEGRVA